MKAVFLDYATMGPGLDLSPLTALVPDLEIFDITPAESTAVRIRDAEIVFTNKIRFDDATLGGAQSLQLIGLTATGTDNVDLVGAEKYGIAVCNIRGYCTQSVAEHVFALLLNLTHNIGRYTLAVRSGEWQRSEEVCMLAFPMRELSAMTLGIVGYGELGRGVEKIAKRFNMETLVTRRPGVSATGDDGRIDLHEMLVKADVVTLHCPLNAQTKNLFGEEEFRLMRPDAILVNTARGGLVDSSALAAALNDGEIGAAAVDVLPKEPPADGDPLLDYNGANLLITPHVAWGTIEARQEAINELAANVKAFLNGQKRNRVV